MIRAVCRSQNTGEFPFCVCPTLCLFPPSLSHTHALSAKSATGFPAPIESLERSTKYPAICNTHPVFVIFFGQFEPAFYASNASSWWTRALNKGNHVISTPCGVRLNRWQMTFCVAAPLPDPDNYHTRGENLSLREIVDDILMSFHGARTKECLLILINDGEDEADIQAKSPKPQTGPEGHYTESA